METGENSHLRKDIGIGNAGLQKSRYLLLYSKVVYKHAYG